MSIIFGALVIFISLAFLIGIPLTMILNWSLKDLHQEKPDEYWIDNNR